MWRREFAWNKFNVKLKKLSRRRKMINKVGEGGKI